MGSNEHFLLWSSLLDRGIELRKRYHANWDISPLQEAVDCFRDAASLSLKGVGDGAFIFGMLGVALYDRFTHAGNREDLDRAILCHRSSLEKKPAGHPTRAEGLSNLAISLLDRFRLDGDLGDVEDAIMKCRIALKLTPSRDPVRSTYLNNISYALRLRFEQLGDRADLDEAIVNNRAALELTPHGHPDRSTTLNNIATALWTRFEQVGDLEDLDEAIIANRSALGLRPPGHPHRSASLSNLAGSLLDRFAKLGRRDDLDDAILKYRAALELKPPGHLDRRISLSGLGKALKIRFEQDGNRSDLDDSILNQGKAVELTPPGHPSRASTLSGLASALDIRFEQLGNRADLDEAITMYYAVLEIRPSGHPGRSMTLDSIATALMSRFNKVGDRADLDEAIVKYRCALDLRPRDHHEHFISLSNLAYGLQIRFEQLGDRSDLDEAVYMYSAALKLWPATDPGYFSSFMNLGTALHTRFEHDGDYNDLNYSIVLLHRALELTPYGHPDRPMCLNNIANSLLGRFSRSRDRTDLDEAIANNRKALELRPPDPSASLNNLANSLMTRFFEDEDNADLDEAIVIHRNALELRPPGHPDRSASLRNLANSLWPRFRQIVTQDEMVPSPNVDHSLTEILELLEEATFTTTSGSVRIRLEAALSWADRADRWAHPSALRAYRMSLEALETLVASSSSMESRHMRLTSEEGFPTRTLAVDGAACALTSGNATLAVEMLEQGRSVFLTQAGRYRTPLDKLRAIHPTLAESFRVASEKMERFVMASVPRPGSLGFSAPNMEDAIANYQNSSREWTDILQRIRVIAGFESFLQPTPFSVLREAATNGPVIIVNYCSRRTDAIIIRSNGDPRLVELLDANPERVNKMVESAHHATGDKAFKIQLSSIWKLIVQPITEVLQNDLQLPPGSRIWWCPTGAISHLPLHAAGDYSRCDQNLPDLFISSYIPTLLALLRTRRSVSLVGQTPSSMLVIGQSETPGQTPLPSVPLEIGRIKSMEDRAILLNGAEATRDAVLSVMSHHSWIHLSCHGRVDQEKPFQSSFALHDGPLTLLDIARQDLPRADLAFLSACHSAAGNRERPDDALHLAAGLQFAGFKTVIGTLWAMCDQDGPDITESFYSSLLGARGRQAAKSSAHALHRAVQELRMRGVSYSRWACFVHFGC